MEGGRGEGQVIRQGPTAGEAPISPMGANPGPRPHTGFERKSGGVALSS